MSKRAAVVMLAITGRILAFVYSDELGSYAGRFLGLASSAAAPAAAAAGGGAAPTSAPACQRGRPPRTE